MSAWSSGGWLESATCGSRMLPVTVTCATMPEITRSAVTFSAGSTGVSPRNVMVPSRST